MRAGDLRSPWSFWPVTRQIEQNRAQRSRAGHSSLQSATRFKMNQHRALDYRLRMVSAQTRSAFVGKSTAQLSGSCSTRMTARAPARLPS